MGGPSAFRTGSFRRRPESIPDDLTGTASCNHLRMDPGLRRGDPVGETHTTANELVPAANTSPILPLTSPARGADGALRRGFGQGGPPFLSSHADFATDVG